MPRLKPLWLILGKCSRRLAGGAGVSIGCDFDGTLSPIQERPEDVSLGPRGRAALSALAGLDGVRVGVFSGRALDDLASRVGVSGVYLSGSSGLETLDERGRRERHLNPGDEPPAPLREALAAWCERYPGAWVEDKHGALAAHYRAVERGRQPAFAAGLRRRVRPFRDRFELIHGKKVFEIQPVACGGKRGSLARWLDRGPAPTRLLLYFGDDSNDEACHALVRDRGGLSVAVGRLASRAEYGLASPDEVVWFLEWLRREREASLAPRPAMDPIE